jgi:hypothetical protein
VSSVLVPSRFAVDLVFVDAREPLGTSLSFAALSGVDSP